MGQWVEMLRNAQRAAGVWFCAFVILCGISNTASAQVIQTVAGASDITGRPSRTISLRPWGIAMAPDGGVYVVDSEHAQVLRFDPIAQTFSVVAGTTVAGYAGDGGPATSAQLNYPAGVAVDALGNLFISEVANGRIRKVSAATGEISTVAGGGSSTADGEVATNALLQGPWSVAVGADGSIYIVEQDANRVRRVAPDTGLIATIAGTGAWGSSGDDGPATMAQLARPSDVALDALGNIYIADQFNHCIRVIDAATGVIRRFAGTGQQTWTVVDGLPALDTPLSSPTTLRFNAQGDLLLTEQDTGRVRRIDAVTGIVSTVAGGGSEFEGVPAVTGRIDMPQGLALAGNGDIYITSQNTYIVQRVVGATGMLQVVAGNGWPQFSGDGGSALLAQMWPLHGVVNANGDLFLNDNSRIRVVKAATGVISTYAGAGPWGVVGDGGAAINAFLSYPTALAIDASGNLFVSDQGNHRIRKIDAATGIINHYAGIGYGYSGDGGPAINAQMRSIRDMATDNAGNLFVIEDGSPRIRRIDVATGIIATIAGNGSFSGPWGDGQLATAVALYPLDAIAVDAQANIYIVQQGRIRRIDAATGIITTIAGTGAYAEGGDGGPALAAAIIATDITLDAAGNIFTTSVFNHRVRRIDALTGIITTVAGTGDAGYGGDGGNATSALLNGPRNLAFDSVGNLFVTETYRVRRIAGLGAMPPVPDSSPPAITANISGSQGANGWYVGDVAVSWSIVDAQSAISSSSGCATTTITSDTSGLTLTCVASSAGGTSSASATIKRDTVAPVINIATPVNSALYGFYSNVSASYVCNDSRSGMSACNGTVASGVAIGTTASGAKLFSVTAVDKAGNSMSTTVDYTVSSQFTFTGFLSPVANSPSVNWINAGGKFAMNWKLPDGNGGYVSNLQSVASVSTQTISCPSGTRVNLAESAGSLGLQFDASLQRFSYRFATNSQEHGCRRVTVRLQDGSIHSAVFRFR